MKTPSLRIGDRPSQALLFDLWGVVRKSNRVFHHFIIGIYCLAFGLTGIFIDISHGYYALKIPLMVLFALLVFCKRDYSFLMGLLITCYFVLKMPGAKDYSTDFILSFSHLIVVLMALSLLVKNPISQGKQRSLVSDFPSVMFLLLILVVIAGAMEVGNWYLFARRFVEILGFVSAYLVGRRFNSFLQSEARLLLLGLGFGLFAFTVPWTVGFVVRNGFGVLAQLDAKLNDIGAQSSSVEAGITLIIFAYTYALSVVSVDKKIKKTSLWVSILATATCFIYISKAATSLMALVVLYLLISSLSMESLRGQRLRIWGLILSAVTIYITVLFVYLPGLLSSFLTRFSRVGSVADTRFYIWGKAIDVGIENPVLGVGAGQFRLHTGIWHAHNDLFTMFSEHGLIGLVSYFLVISYLCLVCIRLYRMKKEFRILAVLYGAVLIAYLGYSQVEPMFFNRAGLLFMFLSGWTVAVYRSRRLYVPRAGGILSSEHPLPTHPRESGSV